MFARPAVGSNVEVVVKSPCYVIGFEDPTHTETYIGQVVKHEPWFTSSQFAIPNSDPRIRYHVIDLKSVVSLKVNGDNKLNSEQSNVRIVNVKGKKEIYQVVVRDGHAESCNCLGFTYRKHCRHLKEAVELIKTDELLTNSTKLESNTQNHIKEDTNMSTKEIKSLSWNDRFALIDHFKPSEDKIVEVFGMQNVNEYHVAQEMRDAGTFQPTKNFNVEPYIDVFAKSITDASIQKRIAREDKKAAKATAATTSEKKSTNKGSTTITKSGTKTQSTATSTLVSNKKRGRSGSKIATAFKNIPVVAVKVDDFIAQYNVSLAVLRQSKRFDNDTPGTVHIRKNKETGQTMIWREIPQG